MLIIGAVAYASATLAYLVDLATSKDGRLLPRRLYTAATLYWLIAFPIGAAYFPLCVGLRPWLLASGWILGAIFLFLERRYPISALGSLVSALSTVLSIISIFIAAEASDILAGPLADWVLWIHISLAFLGVVAFALAAAISILYLFVSGRIKRKLSLPGKLPPLSILDNLALKIISIGFPFYTVALLLGSAQAVRSGTDEIKLAYILASLSWLIYGIVLQARLTAGWRGRNAATLTIIGCIAAFMVVGLYSSGTA
tara:strand:+ start:922 stop:1689 length:768 start_codon:yes stop_codon:yes gene_type:complete